jgi:hypothetical protein
MTHAEIEELAHTRVLATRKVEFIVQSDIFVRTYRSASDDEKDVVWKFVEQGDVRAIKAWIECNPTDRLEDRSHRSLKELGRKYAVLNWSRLTKLELVEEIKRKENT